MVSCFLYGFLNFYSSSWLTQNLILEDQILNCKNYLRTILPCYAFDGKEYSKLIIEGLARRIESYFELS